MTIEGKTDNHGRPLAPSATFATAITYDLCVSQCGEPHGSFQWNPFSQQFTSWLLPWLALVSQLPFGANDKLANLESMLLAVGSPTLAAYSLALTVLNGRWIARLFANYRYPNVQSAVRILSSLQQSPLQVDTDNALLASLIILPQNEEWWTELVIWLDFTHTWSIAAVVSIAWVIIAYIFTIIDYFSKDSTGQGILGVGSIGSLWLWLLPIVVGWLQTSPKCDSIRLTKSVERANQLAYVATSASAPCKARKVSEKQAISLNFSEVDQTRLDECSTPPIFNYARFLPWVQSIMVVSDMFHNVSERNRHHDPIVPGTQWEEYNLDNSRPPTAAEVEQYCFPRSPDSDVHHLSSRRWGLDDFVISRMFIASALALMLQWGTTAGAVIIVWFTPTVGLSCRSGSYIAYGVLSTLVWIMLLTSSILTYYSIRTPPPSRKGQFVIAIAYRGTRWLSVFLRRLGKLLAAINAVWLVASGILQVSNFRLYYNCYCNSDVFWLGKGAYNVILLTPEDAVAMRTAWIGGFTLAAGAAAIFSGFISLFTDPPLPP
ncbi:hypothetical protein GALMADRAFT_66963 [Galerina marginata CBS 339.88]|uniref:Uncharacterized protein n=1 Tax=Galerina marginata (strain CBS 339.88) TaxID=685588 RepID=A0A067TCK6_GALM3|nr:hypothetical protein GALMADRAFT_66963 [Galerina marginata CBS 339.88]